MGKHQGEDVFEVPRNTLLTRAEKWGLLLLTLLGFAAIVAPLLPEQWPIAAPLLGVGALCIVRVARVFRGPPLLRATSAGLWFGGGKIIPWREVAAIYEAWLSCEPVGGRFKNQELIIAFHRRRALLAAPSSLWFTSIPRGRIKISLAALAEPTAAVVAQLDLMRTGVRREERRHRANRKLRGARTIAQ